MHPCAVPIVPSVPIPSCTHAPWTEESCKHSRGDHHHLPCRTSSHAPSSLFPSPLSAYAASRARRSGTRTPSVSRACAVSPSARSSACTPFRAGVQNTPAGAARRAQTRRYTQTHTVMFTHDKNTPQPPPPPPSPIARPHWSVGSSAMLTGSTTPTSMVGRPRCPLAIMAWAGMGMRRPYPVQVELHGGLPCGRGSYETDLDEAASLATRAVSDVHCGGDAPLQLDGRC